jgi:hypothetical protein
VPDPSALCCCLWLPDPQWISGFHLSTVASTTSPNILQRAAPIAAAVKLRRLPVRLETTVRCVTLGVLTQLDSDPFVIAPKDATSKANVAATLIPMAPEHDTHRLDC